FLTFHGAPRAAPEVMAHVHESPPSMTVPMVVLAIGAVVSGMALSGLFTGEGSAEFWGGSIF
ncbi:MAG: hypothetical protein GWO39_04965, partial [Gammaproteobacteria bacterium]|nr:hypothetical protein [Gammaproteobacteria bacterium]NIT63153.1 hypothetical protein [Gammaproteobacteria bacterium]NIV20098.1 hypothetical protein [Gammaproteobacteria bacterium]NIY31733.1 hypothetical protein [Gammaproteobacteria bacterium]